MSDELTENTKSRDQNLDSTGEFFTVGTPLNAVKASYLRRRADDLLYEAAVAGRYAHVIAPDRSGKSSLIASTAARLENNNFRVAVLDLNQLGARGDGTRDAGRWFYNVAYRLLRQLRIRYDLQSWWQDKSVLSNRQRLLEFYSEVILQNVQQDIIVFVDEMQSVSEVPFADQLLSSIRAAHNARVTDPDFNRLTFILLGECDPLVLINEPEASPFNVTQSIPLDDFTRADLDVFATELDLGAGDAAEALDRIYYWTRGQPYLTQKLARAVARDVAGGDIDAEVDRVVAQQLTGRAALHSEPHLSHIHRQVMGSGKRADGLLTLYGRIRKGITVPADLGSPLQRRLMSIGLLEVDEAGDQRVRNRVYEAVFTARWANENTQVNWRVPLLVAAALVVVVLVPLWYTQWLPTPYARVLTSSATELVAADSAWRNLRSFPGHSGSADKLYRAYLDNVALLADSPGRINAIAGQAALLPGDELLPQRLTAEYWDRRTTDEMRLERRDEALLSALRALALSTPERRNRAAMLIGSDYPALLASIPPFVARRVAFDAENLVLTAANGARISQWAFERGNAVRREDWFMTALDVTPLVRRIAVDEPGTVRRIGLTLNISHPRLTDLRIRLTAPSGRAVEIEVGRERSASNEDLRIESAQLADLVGEPMSGTWSLSLRDEATGVAGHLVGWNLMLNSQGLVENFQRGMGIPDPAERESTQFWLGGDGRYAIARATQSDSARIWDLNFASPAATVAANATESVVGLDSGARRLVTATLETVNIWDTARGARDGSLAIGAGSAAATLTRDREHVFVQQRGDEQALLQLWNIETRKLTAELEIAGRSGLVALDAAGDRIAVADFDRAVRVWDFHTGQLLAQIDLPLQPTTIELNAAGDVLGAILGSSGVAAWKIDRPAVPLMQEYGSGEWQFAFSVPGTRFVAGNQRSGLHIYASADGAVSGPAVGMQKNSAQENTTALPAFSADESLLVTRGPEGGVRLWQVPPEQVTDAEPGAHAGWSRSGDLPVVALPGAHRLAIADPAGHVHFFSANDGETMLEEPGQDVSFHGHNRMARQLFVSPDGSLLASIGADNSVRVWDTASGQPRRFMYHPAGAPIERAAFSADGRLLALLSGAQVTLLDASSGDRQGTVDLFEQHAALAFVGNETLYAGSDSGALLLIRRDANGSWLSSEAWRGGAPIRNLAASPRGRYLVLVDDTHRAQQFDLQQGRPGGETLQLPSPVEEVVFSPNGARVLFRTARWVHRAGASAGGLVWHDVRLVPPVLNGAGIVFGDGTSAIEASAEQFYLPVIRDSLPHVEQFRFTDSDGPGLFGNQEQLVQAWQERLGRSPELRNPATPEVSATP